jgi:hypothetical protein
MAKTCIICGAEGIRDLFYTPQFIYTNRMTYEYNPITMEYEVIEGA